MAWKLEACEKQLPDANLMWSMSTSLLVFVVFGSGKILFWDVLSYYLALFRYGAGHAVVRNGLLMVNGFFCSGKELATNSNQQPSTTTAGGRGQKKPSTTTTTTNSGGDLCQGLAAVTGSDRGTDPCDKVKLFAVSARQEAVTSENKHQVDKPMNRSC